MSTLRRRIAALLPRAIADHARITADEARAMEFAAAHDLDGMPTSWPLFTVGMFEQADAAELARTGRTTAEVLSGATHETRLDRIIDGRDGIAGPVLHFDARTLPDGRVTAWPETGTDPLVAFLGRRLWAHDEAVAYSLGQEADDPWDLGDDFAIAAARPYLDDREHGAHLAALVLAGYCGIPAEAVR